MRLLRRLQTPLATGILAALLCLDTLWVADTSTLVWHAKLVMGLRPWSASAFSSDHALVHLDRAPDGSFRITEGPSPYFPVNKVSPQFVAEFESGSSRTGVWAPTTRHYDSRLRFLALSGPDVTVSAENRDQLRAIIAARLESSPRWDRSNPLPALLRQPENSNVETHLPLGYAHNAVTLGLLGALVLSLVWVPRLLIDRRRAKRRQAGLCPYCRYELHGLKTTICPECGELTT